MSYPPQPGYQPMPQDHPRATTSLILGILGLVVCLFCAPFAWRIGKQAVTEIDAAGGQLGGRSTAQAGYVLGLIGTVVLAIVVVVLVLTAATGLFATYLQVAS